MISSNYTPLRAWMAGTVNQAALAAAAEASVTLPWQGSQPLPRNPAVVQGGGVVGMCLLATVLPNAAEANVMYVCEITSITLTNVVVKVKNVGSAASAQQWAVNVLLIDQGDIQV